MTQTTNIEKMIRQKGSVHDFESRFNSDINIEYISQCAKCKKHGIGHDDVVSDSFLCNICWKKIKAQKKEYEKKKSMDKNYPKITNYYSIPLCLKQRLNKNGKINLLNDYKLINPNIYKLFNNYNYLLFDNKLNGVKLRWNNKEKLNAGYCRYNGINKECMIELSSLLLSYRSTKELIETLIHEMIHSYLFIKNLNKDRTSHGCRFLSIMNVINYICNISNLQLTVRHNFIEEVEMLKSHKWRCNGICSRIIYRPSCHPPGIYDKWWFKHQRECGGTYQIIQFNKNKKNLTKNEWEQKKLLKKKEKEKRKMEKLRKNKKNNNNNQEIQDDKKEDDNKMNDDEQVLLDFVHCPICGIYVHQFMINQHLDECTQ